MVSINSKGSIQLGNEKEDRERVKKASLGLLGFFLMGLLILYWFLPLTLEIIEERIVERYFWQYLPPPSPEVAFEQDRK